jgi:hypothetical protein
MLFGDGARGDVVDALARDYRGLDDNIKSLFLMLKDMGVTDGKLALHYVSVITSKQDVDESAYDSLYQNWKICHKLHPLLSNAVKGEQSNNNGSGVRGGMAGINGTNYQNTYEIAIRSFHNTLRKHFMPTITFDEMVSEVGKLMVDVNDSVKFSEVSNKSMNTMDTMEKSAVVTRHLMPTAIHNVSLHLPEDNDIASISDTESSLSLPSVTRTPVGGLDTSEAGSSLGTTDSHGHKSKFVSLPPSSIKYSKGRKKIPFGKSALLNADGRLV